MGGHDPLFERPRSVRIGLEQLFVVIGFNDQRARAANPFPGDMSAFTQVC